MAKRSDIPKFGKWDDGDESLPPTYIACFDNAPRRRAKAAAARIIKKKKMMINPNDPEENSQAFTHAVNVIPALKRDKVMLMEMEMENIEDCSHCGRPRNRNYPADKHLQSIISIDDHDNDHSNNNNANNNNKSNTTSNNNQRRSRFRQRHPLSISEIKISPSGPPSPSSGSGSQMGSESAKTTRFLHANAAAAAAAAHHPSQRSSDWRKATDLDSIVHDYNNTFSVSLTGMAQYFKNRTATRPTSNADLHVHHRKEESSPVPKFGAWDEADPKSGEVFSEILSKLKEEGASTPAHPARSSASASASSSKPKPKNHSSDHSPKMKRSSGFCPRKLRSFPFLRKR